MSEQPTFPGQVRARWRNPRQWEPGDELADRGTHQHSRYIFNFRDEEAVEECRCGDAATWPTIQGHWWLGDGDELEAFIAECREAS